MPSLLSPCWEKRQNYLKFSICYFFWLDSRRCVSNGEYAWEYLDSLGKIFGDLPLVPFHRSLKAWLPYHSTPPLPTQGAAGSVSVISWLSYVSLWTIFVIFIFFVTTCLLQEVVRTRVGAVTGLLYRLQKPADSMKSVLMVITELQSAFYSPRTINSFSHLLLPLCKWRSWGQELSWFCPFIHSYTIKQQL